MPFIEIAPVYDKWVRIGDGFIVISKELRDEYLKDSRKVRIFYDEENNLVGLKPNHNGYKVGSKGRIYCKTMENYKFGRFESEWSEEHKMIIADLSSEIED